jgi:hypothetical protein
MSKAVALVVASGLAASALTLAFVAISDTDTHKSTPRGGNLADVADIEAMRSAAAGAWRPAAREASPSKAAEPVPVTETVTVKANRAGRVLQEGLPVAEDRGLVARDIQHELARVGCYQGEINGVWTTSTREGMKAFIDRVNAALPTQQPDGVLLALVRGHTGKACGVSCPDGQSLTHAGRCVPIAIVSREAKKPLPIANSWSTTTTIAPSLPTASVEGQMALAGPKDEATPSTLRTLPAQTQPTRPPRMVQGSDWRRELWKRQGN